MHGWWTNWKSSDELIKGTFAVQWLGSITSFLAKVIFSVHRYIWYSFRICFWRCWFSFPESEEEDSDTDLQRTFMRGASIGRTCTAMPFVKHENLKHENMEHKNLRTEISWIGRCSISDLTEFKFHFLAHFFLFIITSSSPNGTCRLRQIFYKKWISFRCDSDSLETTQFDTPCILNIAQCPLVCVYNNMHCTTKHSPSHIHIVFDG